MSKFVDYYQLFAITCDASQEEIKKKYRQLALKLHPDLNQDKANSNELLSQLNAAYEVLSDPITRQEYDRAYYQHKNQTQFNYRQFDTINFFDDNFQGFDVGYQKPNPKPTKPFEAKQHFTNSRTSFLNDEFDVLYIKNKKVNFSQTNPEVYHSEFHIPDKWKLIHECETIYDITWKQVINILDNSYLNQEQIYVRKCQGLSYFDHNNPTHEELIAEKFHQTVLSSCPKFQQFVKHWTQTQKQLNLQATVNLTEKQLQDGVAQLINYFVFVPCSYCSQNTNSVNLGFCAICNSNRILKMPSTIWLQINQNTPLNTPITLTRGGHIGSQQIGDLVITITKNNEKQFANPQTINIHFQYQRHNKAVDIKKINLKNEK